MDIMNLLQSLEIFEGLSDGELQQVAEICDQLVASKGTTLLEQDDIGKDLFIVAEGFAEVVVSNPSNEKTKSIVNLGPGQIIGEMALIDKGPRSATVRIISDQSVLYQINHTQFENLCEKNTRIGYIVMRNLASDLSFKLRHQHLQDI
jgi:CRP/FNR family cyclic AMP-dependent transcriptional regulator